MPKKIDYKKLLEKYMKCVYVVESYTFVSDCSRYEFTEYEIRELTRIEKNLIDNQ
jgi:hypothetical protein